MGGSPMTVQSLVVLSKSIWNSVGVWIPRTLNLDGEVRAICYGQMGRTLLSDKSMADPPSISEQRGCPILKSRSLRF